MNSISAGTLFLCYVSVTHHMARFNCRFANFVKILKYLKIFV